MKIETTGQEETVAQIAQRFGGCSSFKELHDALGGLSHPRGVEQAEVFEFGNCFLEIVTNETAEWGKEVLGVCAQRNIECAPRIRAVLPLAGIGSSIVVYQYSGVGEDKVPEIKSLAAGLKAMRDPEERKTMVGTLLKDVHALALAGYVHPHASQSMFHWKVLCADTPRIIFDNWYSIEKGTSQQQKDFLTSIKKLSDTLL